MAGLTPEDIDRIAALAQLRLAPEARIRLAADLAQVLEYIDRLAAVDTDGVATTTHVVEDQADLRADVPRPSLPLDQALANARDADAVHGLFRVPRVIA